MMVGIQGIGPHQLFSRGMHRFESFRVFCPFHDGNIAETDRQGKKSHDKLGGSSRSVFLLVPGMFFHPFPGMFRFNVRGNENAENGGFSFRQFFIKAGFNSNLQVSILGKVSADGQRSLINIVI